MMRTTGFLLSFSLIVVILLGLANDNRSETPDNVIFFISDGCGPASFGLAREYQKTMVGTETLFLDSFRTGTVLTYAGNSRITDSAAGATAFACGVKTYNGAIGVDLDTLSVVNLLEAAENIGMNTALVTTTEISHATPAAFSSHVKRRSLQTEIASQQLTKGIELLVGGGRRHYLPQSAGGVRKDGRNLFVEAEAEGYHVANDRRGFLALDELPVLALFTPGHMSYEIDRPDTQPSVAEMTRKALELLEGAGKQFFIMIEAGRIDHAAHSNDPAAHVRDVLAYDEAMRVAVEFAKRNGNTLVIGTSDHETGGLTLGADSYGPRSGAAYDPEPLSDITSSFERMVRDTAFELQNGASNEELIYWLRDEVWIRFQIRGIPEAVAENISVGLDTLRIRKKGQWVARAIYGFVSDSVSAHARLGWSTSSHTAVDVPIFAYGPGSESFSGTLDNTQVGLRLAELMGVELTSTLPEPTGR
jgi:alkaline phosphatase